MQISLSQFEDAAGRINQLFPPTPLQFIPRLSEKYGAKIYFKREDMQPVRSFKIRGAYNLISTLDDSQKQQGVVCASAGNHAQGFAYSCQKLGIKGVVFMPVVTPLQKINRVKNFGQDQVQVILEGNNFDEANSAATQYCSEHNMVYVHPFDDDRVIAGQGTVAVEVLNQLKPDIMTIAIGGGGLISGVGGYFKQIYSDILIIGVEPSGASSMAKSLEQGKVCKLDTVDTFCDGVAVKQVGQKTFEIAQNVVDQVVIVPEGQVAMDMVELYQNEGIITEPAGALAVSGLDQIRDQIKGKTVVVVICGGNNDISRYPEIMERSLVWQGLKHYFIIEFAQKPGQLRKFVDSALGPNDDIVRFEYVKKTNRGFGAALVGIELQNTLDLPALLDRLDQLGITYKKLQSSDLLYQYLI
jgi:threonine dehydratase